MLSPYLGRNDQMLHPVVGYSKCRDPATGKLLDRSFDIIGIMVYTVLDNEIFHTADDVELISYYESQVSPVRSHGDLGVPAEASRMLAWNLSRLSASSAL